jgi:Prenyltransferase and squalene oxidase repeat
MSWQVAAFSVLALSLAAGFAWYERERPDARIVALVGTLAAFAALGRIAFAAVPNVKPTSDIVLISGYALGGGPGFAVGALAGLTSNFFFGQGPWTPWQMAAWGATGVLGAALAWLVAASRGRRLRAGGVRSPGPIGRWPLALVCGAAGFAFTAIQDVGDWVNYSDHSWAQLWVYIGKGLGFDVVHAAGCLVFALAFGPVLIRALTRFARRLQVTWIRPDAAARLGVALLALALAAVVASPRPARAAGTPAGYLLRAENRDGGFGAAPGQPSAAIYTGWAALGLASAGQDLQRVSHGGGRLTSYLRGHSGAGSDVGSLERTILVLRAARMSPRHFGGHDLVAALKRHLRRDGSVAHQVNLTTFAVLALRAAGTGPGARTYAWLERQQNGDGGFSFAGAGGSSDIDDTGAALQALRRRSATVRAHAIAYLRRHQNGDGGFPQQPGGSSNAQSTAWAIQGLEATGVAPTSLHRRGARSPLAYLRSLVAGDGHVRYARGIDQTPVWVTGEALMALEGKPLPLAPPPPRPTRARPTAGHTSSSPTSAAAPPTVSTATSGSTAPGTVGGAAAAAGTAGGAAGAGSGAAGGAATAAEAAGGTAGAVPGVPGRVSRARERAAIEQLARAAGFATALVLAPVGMG